MRHARIKPAKEPTWHHCYNRIAGFAGDLPFGDTEKQAFVSILKRLATFYTVRVVSYTLMGNHFHIILQTPVEKPTEADAASRYEVFHDGKRKITPGTPVCAEWTERMRDVSWFMRHFQQLCTNWYKGILGGGRRGPLWTGRFKNSILEPGAALLSCWAYVENNPVRAGIVHDAADYEFSSYGQWSQTGSHPFAENIAAFLAPALPGPLACHSAPAALKRLRGHLARAAAEERKQGAERARITAAEAAMSHSKQQATTPEAIQTSSAVAASMTKAWIAPSADEFPLTAHHRVRNWVYGLVIGSEAFVRRIVRSNLPAIAYSGHKLARARSGTDGADPICCWHRVRPALE